MSTNKKHVVKGQVTLMDGRVVPDFKGEYHLPVITHRPHKWAMVDMEDGNIWILRPDTPPDGQVNAASLADKRLLQKITRSRRIN